MCKIIDYPKAEDLKVVESAVSTFLSTRNGATRNIMAGVLRHMMERYKVTRIAMPEYVIIYDKRYRQAYVWPRHFTQGECCPGCGERIYPRDSRVTILTITHAHYGDEVAYGCGQCGAVFGKLEEVN